MEAPAVVLKSARLELEILSTMSTKLNQVSDAYTKELQEIEAELGKLNVGLEVELGETLLAGELEEDLDEDGIVKARYRLNRYLAYAREAREWRLVARVRREYESDEGEITRSVLLEQVPLVETSREVRLAAAGQILKLLQEITKEAKTKLRSLSEVIDRK
jgi:hypothetical protein